MDDELDAWSASDDACYKLPSPEHCERGLKLTASFVYPLPPK